MHIIRNFRASCGVCLFGMIMSLAGYAVEQVGPGEWRIETAEDVSFVEEGLSVPVNAGSTVRSGIFCPEGGPVGVSEVLWKNVKLSDIETFTGKISHKATSSGKETFSWLDANCYHIVTNEVEGYVQCQLQVEIQSAYLLYGFIMRYYQDGNDVKGKIHAAKAAWTNVEGQYLGCNMSSRGAYITVTNTPYAVGDFTRAISDLGIILREDAETVAAPKEIVFASTDESQSDEVDYSYFPCLMTNETLICRNVSIYDIVGISGEFSCSNLNDGRWTEVQGYRLTNRVAYVQMNLVWQNSGKSKRYGANIRFRQYGADVVAYTHWAGYSYDTDDISDPIGDGIKGASPGVTNVANTSRIAIRNLNVRFRPKNHIVGDYKPCVVKEDGWVKLWSDVDLAKATFGPVLMGGKSLDSIWNMASNYNRSVSSDIVTSYYQYKKGGELFTIGFSMQQQSTDVYAKILSARYSANKPLGELCTGDYRTVVTNIVDGSAPMVTENSGTTYTPKTLAICHLTAEYPVKKRHIVTVGDNFNPGCSPVRLEDIKLSIEPSAGNALSIDVPVRGCGVIGVSGGGEVKLGVDLPDTIGLDVDSGTVAIDDSRTIGGKVNVADGAALKFVLATGVRPALSAQFFNIEPGAEIVLASESRVTDIPQEGELFKLVTGCNYADYSFRDVACTVSGLLNLRKARLFVDEDGDIAVEIKPKMTLRITVR